MVYCNILSRNTGLLSILVYDQIDNNSVESAEPISNDFLILAKDIVLKDAQQFKNQNPEYAANPAEVVSSLYKERWEIELFFKWIKQNLRIKKFLGKSENAVKTATSWH